ncbi:hypothetical protein [Streptomyces galbus]|uniref:Uncharacterized protein n=1 Tax=Streptomyces galbus TaxID=33898 RepID=A0A4U5X4C9_STRGB|nr:hypothetical protein [Streptomyces galbus]TKT09927.1 hypothetical protein E4U92_10220 [Streptomyces galbus]GHD31942.1 hypothetical protein GCM10010335_23130 [Streptomyces galbus]
MPEQAVRPSELLAEGEVQLLRRALGEWGGPARSSDELAFGMGFESARDLLDQCGLLGRALADDDPIKPVDWARTLLAAEIVFVSDLVGSGVEWQTTTGLSDEATLPVLRRIQRKLARTVSAYYGRRPAA